VLPGKGDGRFGRRIDYTLDGFGSSASVVADLNHDGSPDLVFASGIDQLEMMLSASRK